MKALRWGEDAASALGETFDVVVAADCMYVEETAGELADATRALAPAAVFSYGRNRQAEDAFADACGGGGEGEGGGGGSRALAMEDVSEDELDELYQCSDVRVVRLRMRAKKREARSFRRFSSRRSIHWSPYDRVLVVNADP